MGPVAITSQDGMAVAPTSSSSDTTGLCARRIFIRLGGISLLAALVGISALYSDGRGSHEARRLKHTSADEAKASASAKQEPSQTEENMSSEPEAPSVDECKTLGQRAGLSVKFLSCECPHSGVEYLIGPSIFVLANFWWAFVMYVGHPKRYPFAVYALKCFAIKTVLALVTAVLADAMIGTCFTLEEMGGCMAALMLIGSMVLCCLVSILRCCGCCGEDNTTLLLQEQSEYRTTFTCFNTARE
eukprot:gnl/TRDRNA2_/TRDRNA2_133972_c0_seq1.p1 gnl/TRDRNA2_/TRDRNA2_133972_c0~~gnl/TRDRNA2_/TRDRNA2_133972_c0_seq1.p1  ORF type:complete len:258 (+),score=28.19 gnl/TRDRNA2_/TRDRNA2_133972_c0_seq1:45-776(+)